jgi:hypothetical protein
MTIHFGRKIFWPIFFLSFRNISEWWTLAPKANLDPYEWTPKKNRGRTDSFEPQFYPLYCKWSFVQGM